MKDMINKIILGDCLDIMKGIEDKSIDMILCDLPYGTTACKWDTIIPFDKLWEQYNRIIKDNGAIVLFGSQPFTSQLISSNIKKFKYELVWIKNRPTGLFIAKIQPMKYHENILIFGNKKVNYNPQMTIGKENHGMGSKQKQSSHYKNARFEAIHIGNTKYPKSTLYYNRPHPPIHPTQKPVALCEYLIKTYTNENEIILDNCIGSGTTAIAAIRTGRKFIGIEKDPEYHRLACERVEKEQQNLFK